jgi:TatD DNase family protein
MHKIVDSHCHLDYEGLAEDLPAMLKRCEDAGVGLMLSISSRVKNFPGLLAIAEKYENVFCTVGTHPHNAHEELDITTADLVKLTHHPKVVGIGEVGLDTTTTRHVKRRCTAFARI